MVAITLYTCVNTCIHPRTPWPGVAPVGMAFRVPTPDVSVVDLTFTAEKAVTTRLTIEA